jgi:hypothetical protein
MVLVHHFSWSNRARVLGIECREAPSTRPLWRQEPVQPALRAPSPERHSTCPAELSTTWQLALAPSSSELRSQQLWAYNDCCLCALLSSPEASSYCGLPAGLFRVSLLVPIIVFVPLKGCMGFESFVSSLFSYHNHCHFLVHDFAESEAFRTLYMIYSRNLYIGSCGRDCWRLSNQFPCFHAHWAAFWSVLAFPSTYLQRTVLVSLAFVCWCKQSLLCDFVFLTVNYWSLDLSISVFEPGQQALPLINVASVMVHWQSCQALLSWGGQSQGTHWNRWHLGSFLAAG